MKPKPLTEQEQKEMDSLSVRPEGSLGESEQARLDELTDKSEAYEDSLWQ